jgi:ankyrin repeat protein
MEAINELLDNGISIFDAAQTGKLAVIQFLIRIGIDLNSKNIDGLTPLTLGCRKVYYQ